MMTDKNEQRLQEEREDAALKLLMKEYVEIEGAALWREFQAAQAAGKDQQPPQREDRESSRGSGKTNRRIDFLMHLGKGAKRAAVIFLVLLCLFSPLVLSVEAFKIPVINYFVTLKDTFSGFSFADRNTMTDEQEALVDLILSTPLPEGCQVSNYRLTSSEKIWFDFEYSGKTAMVMSIYPSDGQINIDTEDVTQVSLKILDYDAVYLQKEGHRLMWMDAERELVFDLYTTELEKDIFLKYVYILSQNLSQ